MTVKIGWFLNKETSWNELVYSTPDPLHELVKHNPAQYSRCPATAHYAKNTFVIRSGYDLELRFDKDSKKIKYVDGSIEHFYIKEMMVQFHPNEWKNLDTPIFQLHLENGFVADEPVWLEVFPPFHNAPSLPGHIVPGTFDIYSWQRMLSYGFEWQDVNQNYVIKRGDPLMYVRFRSSNPDDDFKLVKIEMDDRLYKDVQKCQGVKTVLKNYSWSKLMKINRFLRPRRYIK
jgi:hypothetical protein